MRGSLVVALLICIGASACTDGAIEATDDDPVNASTEATPSPGTTPELPKRAFLRRACRLPAEWVRYIHRGWDPGENRDNDLVIVPRSGNYMGTFIGTSHSGPYDYLQEVPLTFYGPGFIEERGRITVDREVTVADIPVTLSRLMDFDFPTRKGHALTEALRESDRVPRLIATLSIDGGGWNVLNRWPEAWPNLADMMAGGTNFDNAVVGSSPSITPAIHTNMSTGAYPRQHGVTAIAVRADDGAIVGGFSDKAGNSGAAVADPTLNLRLATLGDLWDEANGNRPQVGMLAAGNYPLGLLGFGSARPRADEDLLALQAGEVWATNPAYYRLPSYLVAELPGPERDVEQFDRADGAADGKWRGHDIAPLDATPAFASWQARAVEAMLEREGFGADRLTDLFYVQYKSPDAAGHKWNMIAPEQSDVLRSVDTAIGDLRDWLDRNVGRDRYVLVITADHGQQPLEAGGWPINRDEIVADIEARFDAVDNDRGIIQRTSATSFFVSDEERRANGVAAAEVASFLTGYTIGDNIPEGEAAPDGYAERTDERIFAAVFAGKHIPLVVECTQAFGPG